jgi:hypothetical protein
MVPQGDISALGTITNGTMKVHRLVNKNVIG